MSKDRFEVILEDVHSKMDALGEGFATFKDVPVRLDRIEGRLENLETDMVVVKTVLKEQGQDIKTLKEDVSVLKSDVFELRTDMKIVKDGFQEHSADITHLKAKIA